MHILTLTHIFFTETYIYFKNTLYTYLTSYILSVWFSCYYQHWRILRCMQIVFLQTIFYIYNNVCIGVWKKLIIQKQLKIIKCKLIPSHSNSYITIKFTIHFIYVPNDSFIGCTIVELFHLLYVKNANLRKIHLKTITIVSMQIRTKTDKIWPRFVCTSSFLTVLTYSQHTCTICLSFPPFLAHSLSFLWTTSVLAWVFCY